MNVNANLMSRKFLYAMLAVLLLLALPAYLSAQAVPPTQQIGVNIPSAKYQVSTADAADLYKLQLRMANAVIGRDRAAQQHNVLQQQIDQLQQDIEKRVEEVRKTLKCPKCSLDWDNMRMIEPAPETASAKPSEKPKPK